MRGTHVALGLLGVWLLAGLYVVRPEEQAVVRLCGRVIQDNAKPGLHWRAPWPLTRLNRLRVNEARRVSVGFDLASDSVGAQAAPADSQFLTGDQNIIALEVVVQYRVQDAARYLFGTRDVEAALGDAASKALTRCVQYRPVDFVLTEGRAELQQELRGRVADIARDYELGVQIITVDLRGAFPPAEVSDAFKEVASARGDRDRIIDEARGYSRETVEKARGEALAMGEEAEGYKRDVTARADGEAQRFTRLREEYARAPEVTRARLQTETMEEILPQMKLILSDSPEGRQMLSVRVVKTEPKGEKAP